MQFQDKWIFLNQKPRNRRAYTLYIRFWTFSNFNHREGGARGVSRIIFLPKSNGHGSVETQGKIEEKIPLLTLSKRMSEHVEVKILRNVKELSSKCYN